MAKIIKVALRRQTSAGIACISDRSIVVWGKAAEGDTLEQLMDALSEAKQMLAEQALTKSSVDVIREVCDHLFPGSWDFAAQGGALKF